MKNEIKFNVKYFYMSVMISLLTIVPQLLMAPTIKHFLSILLLFILLIATGKLTKIVFTVFIIYVNIINIVEANIFFHWGSISFLGNRFEVAVRSPLYESMEYLQTYLDYRDGIVFLYSFLILWMLYRFILNHHHNYLIIKKIAIVLFTMLFLFLVSKDPLNVVYKYLEIRNDFFQNNITIQSRNNYLAKYNKNRFEQNNSNLLYDKVIIIQGESVNKNFLNLYGYYKNTTPFENRLINTEQAYKFNVISPSNQTRYSIPMIFTKADVDHWSSNFIHSHSILSDFEDNGYKTYWISNQGNLDMHDDWITNIAKEANVTKFFQSTYGEAKSDIVITNYLKRIKKNKHREMYVFHLIGSHFKYSVRYVNPYFLNKNPTNNIVQEYENTIYFTDFIIKNIFNYFKEDGNILIIYLSDHGEIVTKNKYGHAFLPTYKDEYETPLIIYSSIKNNRIDRLYNLNKKHFFNTENLNYLIQYICQISDNSNISYSSNIFSINPKNKFDYNKLKYYK